MWYATTRSRICCGTTGWNSSKALTRKGSSAHDKTILLSKGAGNLDKEGQSMSCLLRKSIDATDGIIFGCATRLVARYPKRKLLRGLHFLSC